MLGSLFKALAASSEVLEIEVPDLDHQIQYISLSVPDDSQEHHSVSSSSENRITTRSSRERLISFSLTVPRGLKTGFSLCTYQGIGHPNAVLLSLRGEGPSGHWGSLP